MFTSDKIDDIYFHLIYDLVNKGDRVKGTRELNNVSVQLTNLENNIVSIRDISDVYMMAELIWYFTGREDVRFIGSFASLWNKISDDGLTSNSAYGACIKTRYGFNQAEKIIELLKKDPASRRAVINLNVPNEFVIETKDELCTIALQFLLRDGKLNCTGMMRSNDIWFGFPYDVIFFTELQKYIAMRLKVEVGTYTHFVTSLHLYDRDYDKILKVLDDPVSKPLSFDRYNFYDYAEVISESMDVCLNAGKDPKTSLLDMLKQFKIYERRNDED